MIELPCQNFLFFILLLFHNLKTSSAIYKDAPQSRQLTAKSSGVAGSDTKELRLENICSGTSKQELYIHRDSSTVFTFNSSTPFTCHLELELFHVKGKYGFFVVFEEMHLSGTWPHKCGRDTVQFGRDNLIFDSFRSDKYCGVLDKLELKGDEKQFNKRVYKEDVDREMDIWINIPSRTSESRLTLTVTPYKKACSSDDSTYIPCYKDVNCHNNVTCLKEKSESICVKHDLFCDGRVNCPYQQGEAADENSELCYNLKGEAVPLALLIILLIFIGAAVIIIYIMITRFTVCGKRPRTTTSNAPQHVVPADELEMSFCNPTTPASPLNPPPYSEVMLNPLNPPDDPPRYCDIVKQSTDIIRQ